MEDSILTSTKKVLGVGADDESFDLDILTHINSSFAIVGQIGIPAVPLYITDDTYNWADLGIPDDQLMLLKSWIYLKVKVLFDPPGTSFNLDAIDKQLDEMYNRLSYMRESLIPIDGETPVVVVPTGDDVDAASGTVTTPLAVWVMPHNLGFNPAGFRFTTLDGTEELEPEEIQYVTINRALAVWPEPIAGNWMTS